MHDQCLAHASPGWIAPIAARARRCRQRNTRWLAIAAFFRRADRRRVPWLRSTPPCSARETARPVARRPDTIAPQRARAASTARLIHSVFRTSARCAAVSVMEWIAAPQGRASQCLMASMRISGLSSCSRRTRAEDHPVVRPGGFCQLDNNRGSGAMPAPQRSILRFVVRPPSAQFRRD
jgi:hypothetical protein